MVDRSDDDAVVTRTARSRGHTISFEDAGTGTALALVPGWTMSAADWWDAGYIRHLSSSHRVLAVDPLGNGLSDKPHVPGAYRWPHVATDVVAAMDAAQVDKAVVWGYSRGAALAAMVAADFPDRVSGLILHGTGDLGVPVPAGTAPDSDSVALFHGDFAPLWDAFAFSEDDRRYDGEVNDPVALGAIAIAYGEYGCTIRLERVAAPALVIAGGNDGPEAAKKTAEALGADLQVLPGLDHLQVFSRTDLIFSLVDTFLEEHRL